MKQWVLWNLVQMLSVLVDKAKEKVNKLTMENTVVFGGMSKWCFQKQFNKGTHLNSEFCEKEPAD